ncbi:CHAT domain-containing protein [uncultured Nostoc sp.]|uniref:CHAT domain-containing protein n=1 Tax=uncultured Nostoc sp. TaxID=340711 RepID=UPI0035C97B1D
MNKTKIKLSRKYHQQLFWFAMLIILTAWLCITSPGFTQISSPPQRFDHTQNQLQRSLEQQAGRLYDEGKFAEAAKLFQQAAHIYQASSEPIRQALNLTNLSLCYQQMGQWQEANSTITSSIAILNTSNNASQERLSALAQALNIQGGLQLARGQADMALKSWESATAIYTQQNKPNRVLSSKINQAQALQDLGLYRRAVSLLATALNFPSDLITDAEKLKPFVQRVSASPETAIALCNLGDSLRVVGNLDSARLVLEHSLVLANQLHLADVVALAQLSLGNTLADVVALAQLSIGNAAEAQADSKTALSLSFYQQAAASSLDNNIRVQAQLNQLNLLVKTKQQNPAKILLSQLKQQLEALSPSKMAIEARVNLAHTMMQMQETTEDQISLRDIAQLLAVAVPQAQELGNPRLQADTWGSLGSVYERAKQWQESEELTEQAVQLAQQIDAKDIAYRWQWQLGRVRKEQGKTEGAIAAYKTAISTIKSLRIDLASANPDVQFSFRSAVEPIHRELVELLVQSNQKDRLKTARDVIEGLQLVELDNFFREACLNAKPELVDQVDQRAAVIYPIILKDQLAIIVSFPKSGQNPQGKADNTKEVDTRDFRYYKAETSQEKIELLASRLRNNLNQSNTYDVVLPLLQQMYDLIIAHEAPDLAASQVQTLVFVLDGVLRNIPMAALYDQQQKQFLVEKYSIALTPGLQLLAPRSPKLERLGALVAGVSEARPGYSALPNIKQEVEKIASDMPTQILLNEKFTSSAFQDQISTLSFPIVHLATHGQFGSTQEQTYILAWDDQIKVKQLSSLLNTVELLRGRVIELLVLSACETASGDAKSALGLAGIAVRSGASSTVATLWRVNDKASALLMSLFYDELVQARKTGISKAEALRHAQISILQNKELRSPYHWAGYVLLGNWTWY